MAHLTDPFYTRAPMFPCSFTPCSSLGPYRLLTHVAATAAALSQAVRHAGRQCFDPAHTGSVTSSRTVTHASSKQVPGGQQLFALWSGSLGFFPSLDFSLLPCCQALRCSPWAPDSCLAYVCVIYCSAASGLSPASGFSACDSGGMRNWTSSVLMATLSGWSHLLKCSKVLQKSRRRNGWVRSRRLST